MGSRIQKSQDVPTFTYTFESDGSWVEMKVSFRAGDRDAINSQMVEAIKKLNPKTGEEEYTGEVRMNTSLANVATLKQAIVAWGGPGFTTNGKPDEISLENIAGISEEDELELLNALNSRNPKAVGPKGKAGEETTATSSSSESAN
jgi:hypothetical protein